MPLLEPVCVYCQFIVKDVKCSCPFWFQRKLGKLHLVWTKDKWQRQRRVGRGSGRQHGDASRFLLLCVLCGHLPLSLAQLGFTQMARRSQGSHRACMAGTLKFSARTRSHAGSTTRRAEHGAGASRAVTLLQSKNAGSAGNQKAVIGT